jgi:phosphatidylserine decarboxylase
LTVDADWGFVGLARGAPWWVPVAGGVGISSAALAAVARDRSPRYRAAAVLVAVTGGAVCAFFRDPQREPGVGTVLAAADGVVSAVEREPDGRVRVATVMGLRNVHVNRAPIDGIVRGLRRQSGGYVPAFRKDSHRNERIEWTIETLLGDLRLVQIAGAVARRIVTYSDAGERIERGERIGMIRFGSRVDVTLPPGIEPGVTVGQRVRAGRTRLDRADPPG